MAPCHQSCYGLFHSFHNKRNYHASHLLAHFFYYGILLRPFPGCHAASCVSVWPLIGCLPPSRFSHLIEDYDHWIAFGLLAFLGGRMIKESFSNEDKRCFDPTKLKVVVTLAIATSIDALAIGISFAFVGINSFTSILSPIVIIGFTSFVISTLGSLIGVFCGKRFNLRMELWGGLVLIIIGVKILIEHLFLS